MSSYCIKYSAACRAIALKILSILRYVKSLHQVFGGMSSHCIKYSLVCRHFVECSLLCRVIVLSILCILWYVELLH